MRWAIAMTLAALFGCAGDSPAPPDGGPRAGHSEPDSSAGRGGSDEDVHRLRRERMVEQQIRARGISDPRVLDAMRKVPRHLFVPEDERGQAYEDGPLPIGEGQTISQPYIVALMTELLRPKPSDRVLEVGTGSGYQAAVLSVLVREVDTIEIVEPLARRSAALLASLGYANVTTRLGDGYRGWPERAPFSGILVTAAPDRVPEPLKEQLEIGGRMVIPVGSASQELIVLTRTREGFVEEAVAPVRFVPMTGEAQGRP